MAETKPKTDKKKVKEDIDDIFSQLISEQNSVSPEAAVMGTDMFSIVKMWIPTGSMTLDTILANDYGGGWPCGRVVELYGPESIGKSSLCFAGMAQAQEMGGIAIYHDVEQAGAIAMMKANGIDMKRLIVSRLTSIEEIFAALEKNLNTIIKTPRFHNKPVFICIDSLAQMTTDSEIEAGYENNMNIALQKAKQIGKALRKIVPYLNQANAVLVFINQLRDDPGGNIYAGPLTPGGRALKFGASIRLEMRGRTAVKEMDSQIKAQYEEELESWNFATEQWKTNGKLGPKPEKPKKPGGTGVEIILGYDVTLFTEKNKVAAPKRTAEFRLMFGQGIIEEIAWFDWAKKLKIIESVNVTKGLWKFTNHPDQGEFKEGQWTELLSDVKLYKEVRDTIQKALIRPMISTSTSTEDIKDLEPTEPNVIPE